MSARMMCCVLLSCWAALRFLMCSPGARGVSPNASLLFKLWGAHVRWSTGDARARRTIRGGTLRRLRASWW